MPKILSKEILRLWLAVGLIQLVAGPLILVLRVSNLKNYSHANARVIGFEDYITQDNQRNIRPQYEVTLPGNRLIKFTDPRSRSSDDRSVKIGDNVPALYNPTDTSDIIVDSFAGKYGLGTTLCILGLGHTVIPAAILFSRNRARQRQESKQMT